jgi:hypothetical protein
MVNLQLRVRKPATVSTYQSQPKQSFSTWRSKPFELPVTAIQHLWWQTKAYTTILRLMPLVIVSVVFLYIHWLYRKFFLAKAENTVNSKRCRYTA